MEYEVKIIQADPFQILVKKIVGQTITTNSLQRYVKAVKEFQHMANGVSVPSYNSRVC